MSGSRLGWQALKRELRTDLRLMTIDFLVNGILGSDLVPRPVRYVGYRLLGMPTGTPNILPGLRISGSRRRVAVGPGTFVNRGCFFEAVGRITIGRACQIGPEVMILTSHHDRTADGLIATVAAPRDVVVGDRVWLGARALIVPGVTLGDDVAIGAGAVVTRDCLTPGVYVGSPARLLPASDRAVGVTTGRRSASARQAEENCA